MALTGHAAEEEQPRERRRGRRTAGSDTGRGSS
jgi:hypothetical protein